MSATRTGTSNTVVAGSYFSIGRSGSSIASASSIAVTDGFHEVTGSTTINTITGGKAGMGVVFYRPAGATWAFGSAGNIKASAASPTERVTILVTPDGNTWYGEFQGVSIVSANTDISVSESGGTYTLTFNPGNVGIEEFTGTLSIARGGTGQTAKDEAFDALAPTTTRGDQIVMGSAGDNVRLPVGPVKSVLASDGTDPAWDTTIAVESLTVDAGSAASPAVKIVNNKGLYEAGTNELGFAINGSGELVLDASRLAPASNLGVALGDADQFFGDIYNQDTRGWRLATLSTTPGANTIATIPVSASSGVAFIIEAACFSAGTSSNFGLRSDSRFVLALAKGATITSTATAGPTGGVNSDPGTYNFSGLTLSVADAGSNVLNIVATTAVAAGTATNFLMQYKLRFLYGDPAVTEQL